MDCADGWIDGVGLYNGVDWKPILQCNGLETNLPFEMMKVVKWKYKFNVNVLWCL